MSPLHLSLDQLSSRIKTLYIAFSGGIDSVVLLHRLLNYRERYRLVVWHINHGLQDNAYEMEGFTRQLAQSYQLEHRVDRLQLDANMGNLEARARDKRYALFASVVTENDALLTAHHMNDQAETLLLNLMRGSGPEGLSAIALQRPLGQGMLMRPLLNETRASIESYARHFKLQWIEDPSNASLQYDRNYLRHQVLPLLKKRWPATTRQLHRVSEWQNENMQLIQELAKLDYEALSRTQPFTDYRCLSLESMANFSDARKKNLLRFWLKKQGKKVLGYKKIRELLNQFNARADSMPVIQAQGYSIRMFRGVLYIVDDIQDLTLEAEYLFLEDTRLVIAEIGLDVSKQQLLSRLGLSAEDQKLSLKFRSSEKTVQGRAHAHKLKRLFQKHRVPPWIRDVTAQIWVNDKLVDLYLN